MLSHELQCRILARAIRDSLAEEDRYKCIVAVGHGTEDSGLIYYEQLKQALKALDLDIRMITLKTALSTLAPMPEALVLYPLFTVRGYHVKKDVFGESDSIRSTLEAAGHKVTVYDHGLLAMADVRRVYLDRL